MRALPPLALLAIASIASFPTAADAQSALERGYLFKPPAATITLFGGFAQASASSDIFAQSFDELTLGRQDFAGSDRGVDVAITLNGRTDIVFSVAGNSVRRRSAFRDWVDQDGRDIEQTTRFSRTPIGIGARYYLRDRGRMIGSRAWIPTRLLPYVGASVGGMRYRFVQYGDFIDPGTLDVFRDEFKAEGVAMFGQASAGAAWSIIPEMQIVGDLRYTYARGSLGRDFAGFDRIDLSGVTTAVGLAIRF